MRAFARVAGAGRLTDPVIGLRRDGPGAELLSGRFAWLLGVVVLVGALLRFSTLGEQSFWTDEATTYAIVAHGLGHVISAVPKTESTPPLYYVVLWLWSRAFGLSEAGLRSLSALWGVLTIAVVGLVGRRLANERVGLAAAVLTAVNPIMVWYSQEARAYAMVIFLSALSLLLLLWALERPESRRLAAWGVCGAAAISTHYFAVFVIVPEVVWIVGALWSRGLLTPGRGCACLLPLAVVGVALLPLAIHQADGRAAFIAADEGSLPRRVVRLVKQDILGLNEPAKAAFSAIGGLLVVLAGGLLLRRATRSEQRHVLLPLAVGIGGISLGLLAAVAGADYIDTRNLLPTWPALALVIAGGLGAGAAGRLGTLGLSALAALSLACLLAVVLTPLYQRANWRGVAHTLGPPHGERAIIGDPLAYTSLSASLSPYVARLSQVQTGGITVQEVDVFALALQNTPPPHPAVAPTLPGFRLMRLITGSTYVVLRYRAPAPLHESLAALLSLGLMPGTSANQALAQAR